MPGAKAPEPEYIAARRVLLDALEALGAHRKAVEDVVVRKDAHDRHHDLVIGEIRGVREEVARKDGVLSERREVGE